MYHGQRTACSSLLLPSGFPGSNSGHLARWQVPLVSEPSCHSFLEFVELTLNVLEVSKGPNSRATPKEFSAACWSRKSSLQQEYGPTLSPHVTHTILDTLPLGLHLFNPLRTEPGYPAKLLQFHWCSYHLPLASWAASIRDCVNRNIMSDREGAKACSAPFLLMAVGGYLISVTVSSWENHKTHSASWVKLLVKIKWINIHKAGRTLPGIHCTVNISYCYFSALFCCSKYFYFRITFWWYFTFGLIVL